MRLPGGSTSIDQDVDRRDVLGRIAKSAVRRPDHPTVLWRFPTRTLRILATVIGAFALAAIRGAQRRGEHGMLRTPQRSAPAAADQKFDAFLTYTSADRRIVRRIQRFLESFRPPKGSRSLSVYLDETDMRGGSLPDNLSQALVESGALVVCWSERAAASSWVS